MVLSIHVKYNVLKLYIYIYTFRVWNKWNMLLIVKFRRLWYRRCCHISSPLRQSSIYIVSKRASKQPTEVWAIFCTNQLTVNTFSHPISTADPMMEVFVVSLYVWDNKWRFAGLCIISPCREATFMSHQSASRALHERFTLLFVVAILWTINDKRKNRKKR